MAATAEKRPTPTLEQERAAYAFKRATRASQLSGKTPQKYKRLAKGLPQMIMVSGLMPVMAFLQNKGEPHHLQLYDDVALWLADHGKSNRSIPLATLMGEFTSADSGRYRELTTETLNMLRWLRQLASAVIKEDN